VQSAGASSARRAKIKITTHTYMTGRIQKCMIHQNPVKSLLQLAAPPDANDAQFSNGPIGASIRVREVPIQQCQRCRTVRCSGAMRGPLAPSTRGAQPAASSTSALRQLVVNSLHAKLFGMQQFETEAV
jgi:hypothetical protein